MAMTVGKKGVKHDINITPYIDILLVLLIIFMVASPLRKHEEEVRVPQPPPQNQEKEVKPDLIVVEIVRETDGSESVLARLGAGQYFGEAALLSNAPRNATVRASAVTEVAVLGKENFLTMLSLLPTTHDDVLRTVSERAMSASGG